MASGKCETHTYSTFLQRILTSKIMKKNFFCIIYDAMSNIHFSGLDNVKMTCITQVSFKITIRKDMFILTLVDLEYDTSVSVWEFEMMILLKW